MPSDLQQKGIVDNLNEVNEALSCEKKTLEELNKVQLQPFTDNLTNVDEAKWQ